MQGSLRRLAADLLGLAGRGGGKCLWRSQVRCGKIRLLYEASDGGILVIGPHWYFSMVMLVIMLTIGGGYIVSICPRVPHTWYHSCLGVISTLVSSFFFALCVFADPGIVRKAMNANRSNRSNNNTQELDSSPPLRSSSLRRAPRTPPLLPHSDRRHDDHQSSTRKETQSTMQTIVVVGHVNKKRSKNNHLLSADTFGHVRLEGEATRTSCEDQLIDDKLRLLPGEYKAKNPFAEDVEDDSSDTLTMEDDAQHFPDVEEESGVVSAGPSAVFSAQSSGSPVAPTSLACSMSFSPSSSSSSLPAARRNSKQAPSFQMSAFHASEGPSYNETKDSAEPLKGQSAAARARRSAGMRVSQQTQRRGRPKRKYYQSLSSSTAAADDPSTCTNDQHVLQAAHRNAASHLQATSAEGREGSNRLKQGRRQRLHSSSSWTDSSPPSVFSHEDPARRSSGDSQTTTSSSSSSSSSSSGSSSRQTWSSSSDASLSEEDAGSVPSSHHLREPTVVQSDDLVTRSGPSGFHYCDECCCFCPAGSYHCDECQVCIEGYDHHCPWTSKCIGKGNAVFFYIWIFSSMLTLLYMVLATGLMMTNATTAANYDKHHELSTTKLRGAPPSPTDFLRPGEGVDTPSNGRP